MFSPTSDVSSSSSSNSNPSSYTSSATSYDAWSPGKSVHPASLVDSATHSPELMQLINIKLSRPVIDYVVDCVSETVNYAFGRFPSSTGEISARARSAYRQRFTSFVSLVLSRAEVSPATVLVALVYVARARTEISIGLEEWALERVFLGALIVASKYTNDSTLRNVHWALCSGVFGKGDIGRIEREFLAVLDWDLAVSEADLLAHYEGIMAASYADELAAPQARLRVHLAPKEEGHGHVPTQHHRRSSSGAVPELEPSSPQSSAGTLSPCTPEHPPTPMEVEVDMHSPAAAVPGKPAKKSAAGGHGKLYNLLHSLPIPRHRHHHQRAIEV
ncbi:hypothetical protein B0H11DRAFT_1229735 [Mycena galericulata]|nr:hypothetical protein B0H11DRAFT_1229735 [Mycena galericulata]